MAANFLQNVKKYKTKEFEKELFCYTVYGQFIGKGKV